MFTVGVLLQEKMAGILERSMVAGTLYQPGPSRGLQAPVTTGSGAKIGKIGSSSLISSCKPVIPTRVIKRCYIVRLFICDNIRIGAMLLFVVAMTTWQHHVNHKLLPFVTINIGSRFRGGGGWRIPKIRRKVIQNSTLIRVFYYKIL